MNPLDAIETWWVAQGDFPREWIAVEVWHRVLQEKEGLRGSVEEAFHRYLKTELTAERHVGRVLVVRSVIDYYFFRSNPNDSVSVFLNEVEVGDAESREMGNEALARHRTATPAWEAAYQSWQKLYADNLSNVALRSWERTSTLS